MGVLVCVLFYTVLNGFSLNTSRWGHLKLKEIIKKERIDASSILFSTNLTNLTKPKNYEK
jgi:hypothetical protein